MSDTVYTHAPVLLAEVLAQLAPKSGGLYVDATLGRGGHSEAILEASAPDGRLIGIDRDPRALEETAPRLARFGDRVQLVHGAFAELQNVLGDQRVDGLLADLGVSSPQLDDATRGFSFRAEGPLDMRMDPTRGLSARELIAETSEQELANLIFRLGEERRSRPMARAIKRLEASGEMNTTGDLRRATVSVLGPRRTGGIDPATRTFQALRLAVNGELDQLDALLAAVPDVLVDGGVAAIISFHSLEDRAVKRAFRGDERLEPTTKKPIIASDEENDRNPRARSAKLRAARRLPR
ncbi:16S rRNA (cytosine(1402)-N(4))-methyltransferase RsmH [Sandaracinus amylolyticus]|uniref:16S rRNA (cytosine(1402)-N(4))-methyltransferase RsmH n=1 Tax=Sandaracinus amylolyticus TaxID=927083 RepID=UPI001F02E6D4|nr:16S rRNA (cytosine(1402)-N(4))-methyltransferase RsmH [Sandaracinus amylolyticus]UJR80115.1 Ribosomal RNA small subunit methyltransferase H [Sandaracinus amylolyticus]